MSRGFSREGHFFTAKGRQQLWEQHRVGACIFSLPCGARRTRCAAMVKGLDPSAIGSVMPQSGAP